MAANIIELVARLVADSDEFVGEVTKATKTLSNFGKEIGEIARGLQDFAKAAAVGFAAVGAAATAALGAAAAGAAEAQSNFTKVLTQLPEELKRDATFVSNLRKAGYDIGAEFGTGFEDAANAMFEGLGGGIAAEKIVEAVRASAGLAQAGQANLRDVTKLMVSLGNAYGDAFEGFDRVSDQIYQAQLMGQVTIQELSNEAGRLAATAANAGISTSELFAAISTGTQSGIGASQMVSYLGQLIQDLGTPSNEKAVELLKTLGVNFNYAELRAKGLNGKIEEVNAALKAHESELVGVGKPYASLLDAQKALFSSQEAFRAWNALLARDGTAFKETLTGVADATNVVTDAMATVQQNDPTLMFRQIKEEMRGISDVFGGEVLLQFGDFFGLVRDLARGVREWAAANPAVITGLVKLLEVIAGVSFAASALFAGIALVLGVVTALAAVGLPLLITGFILFAPLIAGVVALAGLLYANWDKIAAWARENWPAIRDAVVSAATAIWESLQKAASVISTSLQGAGDRFLAWLTENLPTILAKVKEFASWIADTAVPWLLGAVAEVGEWLEWLITYFKETGPASFEAWKAQWKLIVEAFETGKKVIGTVIEVLKELYEALTGKDATGENLAKSMQVLLKATEEYLNYMRKVVELWGDVFDLVSKVAGLAKFAVLPLTVGSKIGGAIGESIAGPSAFAAGGIVSGPTLALAGEAGPEAFVPLQSGAIPVRLEGGGGARGPVVVTMNIYQQPGESGESLADRIADAIRRRRG